MSDRVSAGRVPAIEDYYRPLVRFHDSSPESWKAMYDVNLHHVLLVTGVNIPVDGGTLAGGGWFYSPGAGRFVNRPTGL